jgi:hypothetical protein
VVSMCETSLEGLGCRFVVLLGERLEDTGSGRVMVAWIFLELSENTVGDGRGTRK